MTGNQCCICRKPVTLTDIYKAHGMFMHKNCFRCVICDTPLHMAVSEMKKEGGQGNESCNICNDCMRNDPLGR